MSSATMKAVFDNLISGAGRRAEQEYDTGSAPHLEVDAIEVNARSARVSTKMHVMDWAEARWEDPEIEAAMDWCHLGKKKSEPWIRQPMKLKSRLGSHKNTPAGKSFLGNADKLTLSGGLLYYGHKPKYQLEEVKRFIVPWAHRRMTIDGCHRNAGHQGKKRTHLGSILVVKCLLRCGLSC